jgi:F-type H+-transporting ATPase subunit b
VALVSFASLAVMAAGAAPAPSPSPSVLKDQCVNAVTHNVVACPAEKTNNFLIPNGTFIFEWIVFIIVLVFLAKKIIPRITAMIDARQETIRKQFEEAEATKDRLAKAEKDYSEALAETRRESSRLREQAQAERAQIVEEARSEAQARVDEMIASASDRIATERQQTILSLRNEIGELATTLAERVVHDSLREDSRQRKLIADFIAGVGASNTAGAGASDAAGSGAPETATAGSGDPS